VRHQVSQTIQQCLEPWSDLRFWYSVLSFWSFRQDYHLTQIVQQWPVIAWENGKVFPNFLSCPPRTRPPIKQVRGNKYHRLKFPMALFKRCSLGVVFLMCIFVNCICLVCIVVILCVFVICVYYCFTLDAGLLARS
jgi:hypothetical protein